MPDKPFPKDEAGVEQMLDLFMAELPGLQATLGLSLSDMAQLENAVDNYHYLRDMRVQIDTTNDMFTTLKDAMFLGPQNPMVPIPVYPVLALPQNQEQGIVPFLKYLIKKIKASADYSESIGEQLNLVSADAPAFNPEEIIPVLTLKALNNGNIEVKFSKQGLDAMRVESRAKGESVWNLAGIYLNSPGIDETPSPGGDPQAREYRGALMKKNVVVTPYSAIYSVVTTP